MERFCDRVGEDMMLGIQTATNSFGYQFTDKPLRLPAG